MQFIACYHTKSLYIIIENNISFQIKTDRRHAIYCLRTFQGKKEILSIEMVLQKSAYQKNLTVYKISNFSNSKLCPINPYSHWIYRNLTVLQYVRDFLQFRNFLRRRQTEKLQEKHNESDGRCYAKYMKTDDIVKTLINATLLFRIGII